MNICIVQNTLLGRDTEREREQANAVIDKAFHMPR